jgi:AAA15 family ATPase/GTPase
MMIGPIHIRNYKSIREVRFEAKRVNLFIGEPNTGKSNIIESLALLSDVRFDCKTFCEIFRFRTIADLFYDQQVESGLYIDAGERSCSFKFEKGRFEFTYRFKDDPVRTVYMDQRAQFSNWVAAPEGVRFYRFKEQGQLNYPEYGSLLPPFGQNLVSILYTNKDLRRRVSDLFRSRDFRLEIKPVEMQLMLAKSVDDELYSFPYESISETWRRIVFFMAVLETNQNSTILFDEPEANTFPFYTTYLAESIALDESNQFFVTTHNPYILGSIVGKTPAKDLAVFVTSMENFTTKLKSISSKGLSKILDYGPDAFMNLDKLTEE